MTLARPSAERFVQSDGARLWTTASGSGTPVVCFNGGPGCDDYLEPVARLIDDTYQVIRFEPRGCGRSDWDGRYDVDTLLADAEAIRVAYGYARWVLLGHSHGPNLALAYALRYPGRALGLIGLAGGKIVNDREWSATYRERLETIGEDTGGKQWQADPQVNPQDNASWKAYCRRPDLLREQADLALPCVFINAAEDIRPNWPTRQLAALLTRARYVEIAGAAHSIWLTHPDALRAELRAALADVLAERALPEERLRRARLNLETRTPTMDQETLQTPRPVRVRPYQPDDAAFVRGLAPRLTIGMPAYRDPQACLAAVEGWVASSIGQHGQAAAVFVAEDADDERLGFASVSAETHFTGERQAYIGELATSAAAEGQGVGRALLRACEDWARAQGFRIIALTTGAANARALGFYHQHGYRDEDIRLARLLDARNEGAEAG